ncbi:type I restriction-modification system subunit M [Sorangium sp. So ce1153]|uniref:type I restriction-modification system subunit M n=1 Tax=Sorangium sp. So ce1153 TaxID=3133333 RepID=UPI003F5FA5CD
MASFLWSVADLLRGDYKQADYGKVILPFTVLRRMECVLAPTKEAVLKKVATFDKGALKNLDPVLKTITKVGFHNASKYDLETLKGDPAHLAKNLEHYMQGFSENVRDIFEQFEMKDQIARLDQSDLLFRVVSAFAGVDLHPSRVPNRMMGMIFEELIRKFAEQSNETAGEHFTPRDVITLMVHLLFTFDDEVFKPGVVRTLYDPAAGTGGMLSTSEEYISAHNPDASLELFGQELNPESYAICKSDMLMRAQKTERIVRGNSFSQDGHKDERFDYMLSNPPFGVEWKKVQDTIEKEHAQRGFDGRFGAGLPRINDGSLLFLQHMISKMRSPEDGGARLAIVLNGSPLFTGEAGSGESEIRRWVLENDWLEAIVALPDMMFYNTGISTYIWVLTNRKKRSRKGKVQLINGVDQFQKMRKGLGDKRKEMGTEHINAIVKMHGAFRETETSKIFATTDFGYRRIVVERPLRLSFAATPERISRLSEESGFASLARSKKKGDAGSKEAAAGEAMQKAIVRALGTVGPEVVTSRRLFDEKLRKAFEKARLDVPAPAHKAVLVALGKRDENGEVCVDARGRLEPDPELRDTENVPLKEDIHAYFAREVKPHIPDAWIDESKTKVGYEIPFTRHFYKYEPPRPLDEIEAEVRRMQTEIQGLLSEVLK